MQRFHDELIDPAFPIAHERDEAEHFMDVVNAKSPRAVLWDRKTLDVWQHVFVAMSKPFDASKV